MKILIDIGHPAHVHFFYNPIRFWKEKGHDIIITSRKKEIATDLLDSFKLSHKTISSLSRGGIVWLAKELVERDKNLFKIIKKEKPDLLLGIGGIFIAHIGFITRTPSIVFYDTENATLSNLITYPFCSEVVVPECYKSWTPPWHLKYPGYHELSYLHPNYFTPNKKTAVECGLSLDRPTFLIRTVSWQASHDLSEKGWNIELLRQAVTFLKEKGKVLISAEGKLPEDLMEFRYTGPPEKIHHLMAHVTLFIGESATMASECAVLGVPAIYSAKTGRGYTDEQEEKYKLVFNIKQLSWPILRQTLSEILNTSSSVWNKRKTQLLNDKIDVAYFVSDLVMNYPESLKYYSAQFSSKRNV